MLWGLVEENGVHEVSSVLKAGQSITIPKGLMRFGQNLGCEPAQVIESFLHRNGRIQAQLLQASNVSHPPDTWCGWGHH
jgi:hypothetical protein